MAWNLYQQSVTAQVGSSTFVLPMGSLKLANEPVSRSGSLAVPLFNGRVVQQIDGWYVKATFDYAELSGGADDTVREFIEAILDAGSCTIDFDPDDEFAPTAHTIDFVLLEAPGAVQATFSGRARGRSAAFQLISRRQFTEPIEWLIQ